MVFNGNALTYKFRLSLKTQSWKKILFFFHLTQALSIWNQFKTINAEHYDAITTELILQTWTTFRSQICQNMSGKWWSTNGVCIAETEHILPLSNPHCHKPAPTVLPTHGSPWAHFILTWCSRRGVWARWPSVVPSNLPHSVIQCFCDSVNKTAKWAEGHFMNIIALTVVTLKERTLYSLIYLILLSVQERLWFQTR